MDLNCHLSGGARSLGPPDFGVAWAFTRLELDAPRDVIVGAGGDDHMRLWIDGALVVDGQDACRCYGDDLYRVPLHLGAGSHAVLVQVGEGTGHWGFNFRLSDAATGAPVVDGVRARIDAGEEAAPAIACNAPNLIRLGEPDVRFTATATDACSVPEVHVAAVRCTHCRAYADGASVVIAQTYRAGAAIEWDVVARDAAGNVSNTTCRVVPVTPPVGLVGAWGFDEAEGDTLLDASPAGHHGRLGGAARAAGHSGGGLAFDGSGAFALVPDAGLLDLRGPLTLSAWVRPAPGGAAWATVLAKERAGGSVYALYAATPGGRAAAFVHPGRDVGVFSGGVLVPGRWSHVATVLEGGRLQLFVDGVRVGTRAASGAVHDSRGALRFGAGAEGIEAFAGTLDDVRLHDRALGVAELRALAAAPVGAP